jgi:hypothetical protein
MPEKHRTQKSTTTTPESGRIYSGATQSDYFVMENREITPAELKQFEILLCGTGSKK